MVFCIVSADEPMGTPIVFASSKGFRGGGEYKLQTLIWANDR